MKAFILFLLLTFVYSCFPSFAPRKVIVKKFENGKMAIEWINQIGILDQNFPDYILVKDPQKVDTICVAHNIADLKFNSNIIIIGFYGTPQKYNATIKIPNTIWCYKISIDTTYIKIPEVLPLPSEASTLRRAKNKAMDL
jgi:hypothetical protein